MNTLPSSSTTLQVLGKPTSINVRKVLWTCEELGIPFELESWGSGFQPTNTPEFLALNPNAMVPVLRDGALTLWESNTICRYLASKHKRTDLFPTSLFERAIIEQWMDWQATELNNAWRYAFMSLVRKSELHTNQDAIESSVVSWNKHMGILNAQLSKTNGFVTGDQFTLADIVLSLSINRWLMTPMKRPDFPAVSAYIARLENRQGFHLYCFNGIA